MDAYFLQSPSQEPAVRSEVLQQIDIGVEADQEGQVFLFENRIEESVAGVLLERNQVALRDAGVDQQADGQWQVSFLGEEADLLGLAFLQDLKIFFLQIVDEPSLLVLHRAEDVDQLDDVLDNRQLFLRLCLRLLRRLLQAQQSGQKQDGHPSPRSKHRLLLYSNSTMGTKRLPSLPLFS